MADEIPEQRPAEELKKDTVRINLPPGLTGRPLDHAAVFQALQDFDNTLI